MDELLARIRAALRRQPPADATSRILTAGEFRIDLDAHTVTQSGTELHLTPKEFDLLVHLLRNAGKVLTHRTLLARFGAATTPSSTNICASSSDNCARRSNPILPSLATS